MKSDRTVAIVHNADWTLYRFRAGLMRELKARGLNVLAVAPAGKSVKRIEADGFTFFHWRLARRNLKNPLPELASIVHLWSIYRKSKPDLAHHYYLKPNVYGALAARLAGVKIVVASVNGLGYIFTATGAKARLLRPLVMLLYRLAFSLSDAVIFQNRDDAQVLKGNSALDKNGVFLIPGGSGVDLSTFDPTAVVGTAIKRKSLDLPDGGAIVLLIARMLWHKGIAEFVECASLVRREFDAHFLLVGPVDPGNPASIPSVTLRAWQRRGDIRYLGERQDIPELLSIGDVLVLPSYREGMSRTLMEGAAMGKAIVTSDTPGCRDVVEDGVTGLLVPPRDVTALAAAVRQLLSSDSLRRRLSAAARQKALQEFDERAVVSRIVDIYDTLLRQKGLSGLRPEA